MRARKSNPWTALIAASWKTARGGPLRLVRSGDRIRLSVAARTLSVLLSDDELAARATATKAYAVNPKERGYRKLFLGSVTQADEGCDFDFLRAVDINDTVPKSGS